MIDNYGRIKNLFIYTTFEFLIFIYSIVGGISYSIIRFFNLIFY